jgi:glutamine amidotransferase PdxT
VLVREGQITAATFHPELTGDFRVHAAAFGKLLSNSEARSA